MTLNPVDKEYELTNIPKDGISSIKFCPGTQHLLMVTSWDSTARIYDVQSNTLQANYSHKSAVLDGCFSQDQGSLYSGGLDKTLKKYDIRTGQHTALGSHESAIKCVEYSSFENVVITGSWDKTVRLWDERQPNALVSQYAQPDKVFTMAKSKNRLVIGTAGRSVGIYDLRALAEPQQRRESSLECQTRCIRTFPDEQGFALSSIEGRVAIEYFDPSPQIQQKKYAFKCHRKSQNGVDTVFPVNALAFHPIHGTFATGGCDSIVNIWDGQNKKRLCQLHPYPTSIAALDFNSDGSLLAIASSYTFEEGEKEE